MIDVASVTARRPCHDIVYANGLNQGDCGRVERTTDDTATCGVLLPPWHERVLIANNT
jgi:hypothetical protein